MCAMTIVDRYGYGTMRFAPICCQELSDGEARILTLFVTARCGDLCGMAIAASVVAKVGEAMR